jgi:hypothetical protein
MYFYTINLGQFISLLIIRGGAGLLPAAGDWACCHSKNVVSNESTIYFVGALTLVPVFEGLISWAWKRF